MDFNKQHFFLKSKFQLIAGNNIVAIDMHFVIQVVHPGSLPDSSYPDDFQIKSVFTHTILCFRFFVHLKYRCCTLIIKLLKIYLPDDRLLRYDPDQGIDMSRIFLYISALECRQCPIGSDNIPIRMDR